MPPRSAEVAIRAATAADVPALAAVQHAAVTLAYAGIFDANEPPPTVDALVRQWATRLQETGAWTAVGADGAAVVATAHLGPDGELSGFYVHPDHWGRRVGSALHDAALAHGRAAGLVELFLWTLEANIRGRRYYERRGWRLIAGTRIIAPAVVDVRYSLAL